MRGIYVETLVRSDIENYAYRDRFGRETVTWIRTFDIRAGRSLRFVHDLWGTPRPDRRLSRHTPSISPSISTCRWMSAEACGCGQESNASTKDVLLFSGIADVVEWFDDADQRFHIDVCVSNSRWEPSSDTAVVLT
jgi:hypothetical protein